MKLLKTILKILIVFSIIPYHMGNTSFLHAKPYIPKNDSVILEQLPAAYDRQIKKLRQLRAQLSKTPEEASLAVNLARAYIQLGRTQADPRFDGYAESALQPWWNMATPPPEVLILRATIRQRQHDFDPALLDLTHVIDKQPNNAQAWLTQAVIHQVRGNYHDARRSCLSLLRLTNTVVSTTCIANVTSMNGHAQKSYEHLQKIIEADSSAASEEQHWALTILAEMATRLGKYSEAEQYFQEALTVNPQDTYLLGAYSDFLLDQNRPAEVQALIQNDIRPDGLLLRLALAEQLLDAPTLEQHVETLKARFAENQLRGEARHLREEARFTLHLLDQPRQALELALENWNVQREPWDARIVLEAAIQSGDRSAAQPVLNWLTAVKLEDVHLERLTGQLS